MGNALYTSNQADTPISVSLDNPHLRKILKDRHDMTGWERVKALLHKDEYQEYSPELMRVKDATMLAAIVGGLMGGFGRSRIAYMDFFRQNTATIFETPLQAKKQLQDKVILGMGSGAWRIGWRMSAFTFMYMGGAAVISAYRGKVGFVDQMGGAGIAGFLYKIRDGPKPAISGAVFGSLLGLTAGAITFVAVKLLGMNLQEANEEYYKKLSKRQEADHEIKLRHRESVSSNLENFHQALFIEAQEARQRTLAEKEKAAEKTKSEEDSKSKLEVASVAATQNSISQKSS